MRTACWAVAVWGLLSAVGLAAEEPVVFQDRFDGKLGEGWTWLRENPQAWRVADGALEIRVEPGAAPTVKNALLRKAPARAAGKVAIDVTVTFTTPPTQQYEQAGLTWYSDGKPVFKLVHEQIDGKTYIIPGKVPAPEKTVRLRLIVTKDRYTAQFQADAKGEFRTVAEGALPPAADEQVSLQCYNGPPDAEHWIRFDDFRIAAPGEGAPPPAGQAQVPSAPTDKTLVVWTAPADLAQRGGSALTLEKPGGVFDAVVFGELAPAKWMPGSNGFSRTEKDQAAFPAETADPRTLVQIAIVYEGNRITIHRNGAKYAGYAAAGTERFGDDSLVLMGLRHLDAMPADRFYIGSIEDARIYGVALDEKAIASLRPNEPSDPKPLAWWSFEDGKASDHMGRFPVSTLVGDARVAGGRLHLDRKGAYMMASKDTPDEGRGPANLSVTDSAARALREKLLNDPHRPAYHFVIPEGFGMPFDPNGAIFWKGRYHLFYIFQDQRGHNWGHVSSTDLCHWRHHPTGLVSGMFSGNAFLNKDGRPTVCYHQVGQGNAMAVALDDELNRWEKLETNPITPKTQEGDPHHGKYRSWDPYGWLEGDTYYAIFGGERPAVAKAADLGGPWQYVGDLMANTVEGVSINEDVSCADFFKIGGKHMLLCISHRLGSRYYLGQWKTEQFHPEFHERMSWVDNAFFAPESLLDDKGRRIMWAWIFDGRSEPTRAASGWSGTMSLPRVLALGDDGMLRMSPVEELGTLRYNGRKQENLAVAADSALAVEGVRGNCLELALDLVPDGAKRFGVKVCCSPGGEEQTAVYYDVAEKKIAIDTRKSSLGEGPKSIEAGPLELKPGEPLTLRVFVDKSVVEVFANGRQAVMRRIYPSREDSLGVVLFSEGGATRARSVSAWDMMPSNPF